MLQPLKLQPSLCYCLLTWLHSQQERKRLAAKGLSRISQSRERFLLEKSGGENGANSQGPVGSLVSGLRTFVRIEEGQSVDDVAGIVKTIDQT